MGLIKSMVQSVGGTLHDQWQDLIQCENMGNELLMKKVTTPTGQISKGSRIIVAPGQMAVILDSGMIMDATAESGAYEFDQSSSPSFFGGDFGEVFKEMWQRFKYNGTPAKGQAVYFFNMTEILGNKFGTATPIVFQDWSHPIPNQMTGTYAPMRVEVRCYGTYTFSVGDPVQFMQNVAGAGDEYRVDQITDQMRAEVIGAFQNVLNELGSSLHKVPVMELPSRTDEIKTTMDEKVFDQPIRDRGLKLRGFVGVGMMNMASGGMVGGAVNAPFQNQAPTQNFEAVDPYQQSATQPESASAPVQEAKPKFCSNCGNPVTGNFCSNCGTKVE